MNQLNTQKKQTLDYSKGMSLKWRNDDDLPSSVEVMGQNDSWNKDPVRMDFAYKGGARIAKFRNSYTSTNALTTNEARYYLLGGKEIRIGEDGKIRAMMYPSYAGSGRTTINVAENSSSTEFSTLDYLGSTARVNTLENGTLKQTLSTEYDSWGREIQSVEVANSEEFDDRFTGKKKDVEMGLRNHGARLSDLDLGGMWISPDKKRQFFNLYGYMGNSVNPLSSADEDGNYAVSKLRLLGVGEVTYTVYFNPVKGNVVTDKVVNHVASQAGIIATGVKMLKGAYEHLVNAVPGSTTDQHDKAIQERLGTTDNQRSYSEEDFIKFTDTNIELYPFKIFAKSEVDKQIEKGKLGRDIEGYKGKAEEVTGMWGSIKEFFGFGDETK
jgi:RHS repeat-associated protein